MSHGLDPQISRHEQRLVPPDSRTSYEAPGWGDLSGEEIEAMRGRIDAAASPPSSAISSVLATRPA